MRLVKGSGTLLGAVQDPIASTGNTAATNSDQNRGGRRTIAGGMRQNVTLPIPHGRGFPPIPSRNDFLVRKHSLQVRVAHWSFDVGGLDATTTHDADVLIHTPSNRLRLAVYGVFESPPASNDVVIGTTVPIWTIRAMSKNPKTGLQSALQLAYPATGTKPLPDSYELDSAVTLLRARLVLAADNFDTGWGAEVYGAVICTWEPNTPIADRELDELYAACALTPGQGDLDFTRPPPD